MGFLRSQVLKGGKKIMNILEIKERAVKVEKKTEVYWPQFNSYKVINNGELNLNDKKMQYSYCNGVIAFVDENGEMYVIPDNVIRMALEREGYTRNFFEVPFSNWDCPTKQEKKWNSLWQQRNEE